MSHIGWDLFSIRADSYTIILLSATTSLGLRTRSPQNALNRNRVGIVTPPHFIIQVNTYVLDTFQHLSVHHKLFGFPCIELQFCWHQSTKPVVSSLSNPPVPIC